MQSWWYWAVTQLRRCRGNTVQCLIGDAHISGRELGDGFCRDDPLDFRHESVRKGGDWTRLQLALCFPGVRRSGEYKWGNHLSFFLFQ